MSLVLLGAWNFEVSAKQPAKLSLEKARVILRTVKVISRWARGFLGQS